jgi:hypothetical protein
VYFLEFALKIISKENSGKSKRALETQVEKIIGTRKVVLAHSFYTVSVLLNVDIDSLCDELFNNIKPTKLYPISESENKLSDFLSPFVQDIKVISSAVAIKNSRLSRLLSGEFKHLYPNEVYSMAIFFGLKPNQLFCYFYGEGERPIVGV